jgi:hypothetical protein
MLTRTVDSYWILFPITVVMVMRIEFVDELTLL